jgi:hypothetical protein
MCFLTFGYLFKVYWYSIQDMKALELELTLKANCIFELSAVAEKRIS